MTNGRFIDAARRARFERQLLVPDFGESAQARLSETCIRAVTAGAAALVPMVYLVLAGVGRIWLEDRGDAGPEGALGWLQPAAAGVSRTEAIARSLAGLSRFTVIEPYPVGGVPDAALIMPASTEMAISEAEAARRASIPHVVMEPDGDGGAVVSIPAGAPCYACARSTSGAGRPAQPGVAALGALAALELLQLIIPGSPRGRRLDLVRGVAHSRPTGSRAGCACASARVG